MKLKQMLAGVLTAVMVVANVPSLGAIPVLADEVTATEKHYRYRSVEGMKVTADWNARDDAPLENLLDDTARIALSRYNTGGIPRSSMMTGRNNIYIPLDNASDITKITWWTDNDTTSGGRGWNVEQGTITRCKISVTTSDVSSVSDAAGMAGQNVTWVEQTGDIRFDSAENDNTDDSIACVAHDINLSDCFTAEQLKSITAVKIEVLNTAGQYIAGDSDNRDVYINGREVEIFNGASKLTLKTPVSDFSTQSGLGMDKMVDGKKTRNKAGGEAERMHSKYGTNHSEGPIKDDRGQFFANNNIYFELPQTTTIGKLTYVSGTTHGSIQRCKIYVSDAELADGQTAADITDWGDPVFSNADDANGWRAHSLSLSAVGNSKEAVFDSLHEAKYVRLEVINAQGTGTAVNNKWISGRSVYIYEAEEVNPSGQEVDNIELTVEEPVFNSPLRRPSTPNGTSYHVESYDWYKDGSSTPENKDNTDFGAGAYTLHADVETEDTIARITNATVNGNPARIINVEKDENVTRATIAYTFAPIEDSTAAWTALKDYVNNTAKAIYDAGNVMEDQSTQKYTARTWKRFETIYTTAYTWTINTVLDNDTNDNPAGSTGGAGNPINAPSGHSKAEYENMLEELKKYCEPNSSGLVEIANRRAINVEKDKPDVTVVPPEAGETPQNANLSYTGIIDTQDVKIDYRSDFRVDDDGWIHGTAQAPKEYPENDIFRIDGDTNFLVHFKVKVDDKVVTKQTIIGMLDDGYGLQILNGSLQVFGRGLRSSDNHKVWPTTIYNFTDDFYGEEHDIVAIFNGSYFHLYVDGNPGSERNQADRIALNVDENTVFSIGYNPNPSAYDVAEDPRLADQSFKGAMKDFNMYIGDSCPDYSELTADGVTAETFLQKLPAVLTSKEPTLTLNGAASEYEISQTSPTKWEELNDDGTVAKVMGETDTFKAYTDYKVTATIETKTGLYFSDDQGIMRTGDGTENELAETEVALTDEDTVMTLSYVFKGEDHPYDALKKVFEAVHIVGTVDNETNENAAGERLYTKASWSAYETAYAAAKTLAEGNKPAEGTDLAPYTTAKTNLETAIAGLKDAATTCECTLGTISGFEGGTIELRSASAAKELSAACTVINTDCLKHADGANSEAPVARNDFSVTDGDADGAASASITGNTLTVTGTGIVKVALTVKLFDGDTQVDEKAAEAPVTFTVASPIATEEDKADLKAKVDSADIAEYKANKDDYTEATQTAMDAALQKAETVLNSTTATLKEVADALEELNAVQLVKKDPVGDSDKTQLQDLMNEIAALDMNEYTTDSWNAMKTIYDKAYQMIEDGADDYSAVLKELQDAKAALKTKAQDQADAKAEANKAVADADAVMKAGKGDYSDASWNAFTQAYNAAKNAPANADAATLRRLAKALSDAQKALMKDTVIYKDIQYKVVDAGKKTAMVVKGTNKKAKNITVPATVTIDKTTYNVVSIGANAFKGFNKATKATIGQNVVSIEKNAFSGCKKLKKVTIKSSVLTSVHKTAFKKTAKGINAKVPKSLKKKKAVINKIKKAGIKKIK